MIPPTDPLRAAARSVPDTLALIDPVSDRRYRYAELDARVDTLAGGLRAYGVDPGDRVIAPGMARGELVELAHAVRRCRATIVPMDSDIDASRFERRLDLVEPAAIIELGEGEWEGDRPDVASIRSLGESRERTVPDETLDPDDTIAVLFTSGTTGRAKAVRLSLRNVTASAIASAFHLGVQPDDRWLCCLATHHVGGFAPLIRSATYGTGLVMQPFDLTEIDRTVRSDDVTGISLVPTMLRRALDARVPLHELRVVLLGGARTPRALVRRALDEEIPIYVTYGMTETCSHVAMARPLELADQPKTVGRPLRWSTISVRDDRGEPAGIGEVGEIVVHGPTVTSGYLDDENGQLTRGGGFRTADRGYVDADGRLFVTGRVDDRIISGGVSVDPSVVERALIEIAGVEAAAAVGVEDDKWGERVCAMVETGDPSSLDPDKLVDAVARRLGPAERPRSVIVDAAVPRTASGSVDRWRVRQRFEKTEDP